MMGKGAVSLSDSIKDQIVASIREEFEKREKALKDHYDQREQKLLAEFAGKLAAKNNEIDRLKNKKKDKSGNDPSTPSATTAGKQSDMPIETLLEQSEQQKAKAPESAF